MEALHDSVVTSRGTISLSRSPWARLQVQAGLSFRAANLGQLLAEEWQCPYTFSFAGKSSLCAWLWGTAGDNSGGPAFLGKFSRQRNNLALHQPRVQLLDPSLSHTPWLWQKRLHGGAGDDCGTLAQRVRGGRWQDGVRFEGEMLGFAY